jgi:hypothetical protein
MMRYTVAAILAALTVTIAAAIRQSWLEGRAASAEAQRDASRWRDDQPVTLLPDDVCDILSIVTCTRCSQEPSGVCTCGIRCVHPACVFDQSDLDGFSQDELEFLDGKRGLPL